MLNTKYKEGRIYYLIFLFLFFSCTSPIANGLIIEAPQISNVDQLPKFPPPNYEVNITCLVTCEREISNVELKYSVKGNHFISINMILVKGNTTNGFYLGIIPPQLANNIVTYYITAEDAAGFKGKSKEFQFTVTFDTTPPSIYYQETPIPENFPVGPITEYDYAKIIVNVTDKESGIEKVILYYDSGDLVQEPFQNREIMSRISGTIYDGAYSCLIPPHDHNTTVWYYIDAMDHAGKTYRTHGWDQYIVNTPTQKNCFFQIRILDISPEEQTITFSIYVSANIPSPFRDKIVIWYQLLINNVSGPMINIEIPMFRNQRFNYNNETIWQTKLFGNLYSFPFDTYSLGLKFEIYYPGFNNTNTRVTDIYLDQLARFWSIKNTSVVQYSSTDKSSVVKFSFLLSRSQMPIIILPIFILFFILGSTLVFTYCKQDFEKRILVLLSLYAFVGAYTFAMQPYIPTEYGTTLPQILTFSVLIITSIFLIVGVIITQVFQEKWDQYSARRNEKKIDVSLLIIAFFALVSLSRIRIVFTEKYLCCELWWVYLIIMTGLSTGFIFKYFSKYFNSFFSKLKQRCSIFLTGLELFEKVFFLSLLLDAATTFIFGICNPNIESNIVLRELLNFSPFFSFVYLLLWGFLALALKKLFNKSEIGVGIHLIILHGFWGLNNISLFLFQNPFLAILEKTYKFSLRTLSFIVGLIAIPLYYQRTSTLKEALENNSLLTSILLHLIFQFLVIVINSFWSFLL